MPIDLSENGSLPEILWAAGPERPDLVFGLVIPVGTPVKGLRTALDSGLRSYGYTPEWIKMSDLLRAYAKKIGRKVPDGPENSRIEALMAIGDSFCEEAGDPAAVALDALFEIGTRRAKAAAGNEAVGPRAWILDSLKRDQEVLQLRQVYGDHAVVMSAQASSQTRKQTLSELISPKLPSMPEDETERLIEKLLARDLDSDTGPSGQNILKTFPMADCFIRCDSDAGTEPTTEDDVERVLDLLFGNPEARIPTNVEFGMYLATAVAARSPELGRKVGAAILDGASVSSLGANSHPLTPTQSPQSDRSKRDLSRLMLDTLRRLANAKLLDSDSLKELAENPDSYVESLLSGPMKGSQLASLTEFQVPVHAEMTALLDALAQGKQVSGQTIFVTAYPCHGCARHILRADLQVVYLDPYPKSRAAAMYGRDVADRFRAFTGVAPNRYLRWFSMSGPRAAADGSRIVWGHTERLTAEPLVTSLEPYVIARREEAAALRSPSAPKPGDADTPAVSVAEC
jgi:deoxycytidylate deaminase